MQGVRRENGLRESEDEKDLMDLKERMDAMDGGGAAVRDGRRAEGTPTVFSSGPLGKRSGMKGSFEARLLFGVAPSDHEMSFVIMG